jgi:3-oxoacyl-[acyl-carrier protein] reductase
VSRLAGRAAVVTGAARGIGLAVTARLLAEGASVTAVDRDEGALREAVAGLDGDATAFAADVADRPAIRDAVAAAAGPTGRLDIMVAHAGIAIPTPFLDETDEGWRNHQRTNAEGAFVCVQEAARRMTDGGGGAIVVTSSINAFHVEQTMTSYNVSKAATTALVRSAAIDLGALGVRVNGVAPGVVRTRIAALVTEDPALAPSYLKTIPLGRFGEPEDIASAVAFLVSDDASYVTGQVLVLDGGQTLGITGALEPVDEGDVP